MPNLTRRHALLAAAAALPAFALASCANTELVTITQAVVTDAQNIFAGLSALQGTKGPLIPAATLASISTYLGYAETALTTIAKAVGGSVSQITAQGLIGDLESALNGLAPFFPGNPYLLAVQALLPIVAAALSVVLPASVAGGVVMMDPGVARSTLGALPKPSWMK